MTAEAMMDRLNEPGVLHSMILRGELRLTREQALHIAGASDRERELQMRVQELEKQVRRASTLPPTPAFSPTEATKTQETGSGAMASVLAK